MAHHQPTSIILIGMPGAGKSTIGILLAKELGLDFLDTDVVIQVREGKTLQEIMDESNYLRLRDIEEQVLLSTDCHGKVVATGGSAVYSEEGMAHLKRQGLVVFLDVPLRQLTRRIHNYESRGIARHPNQSFPDLFEERCRLYRQYADITIPCGALPTQEVLEEVVRTIRSYTAH
ncbi:MAG: shikimate kinase [Pseudomonadales bacterium]|nr:shikimate kinase [Pseudomonadales bacterium]